MNGLNARIRHLAREEATALLGVATPVASADANTDRVAELEQAVTSLHGTVLRLEARLDALEKAASGVTARRTPRKTAEPTE